MLFETENSTARHAAVLDMHEPPVSVFKDIDLSFQSGNPIRLPGLSADAICMIGEDDQRAFFIQQPDIRAFTDQIDRLVHLADQSEEIVLNSLFPHKLFRTGDQRNFTLIGSQADPITFLLGMDQMNILLQFFQ